MTVDGSKPARRDPVVKALNAWIKSGEYGETEELVLSDWLERVRTGENSRR